jgi:hypothetical protein
MLLIEVNDIKFQIREFSLICSIYCAFISCTKCITDQQMHCNCIDEFSLQYFNQQVSTSNSAIFRANFLRTRIQLWLKLSKSLHSFKNRITIRFLKHLFLYCDKFFSTESVQDVEWSYRTVTMNTGVRIWTEEPLVKTIHLEWMYKNIKYEMYISKKFCISIFQNCYSTTYIFCNAFNNQPKAQKTLLHLSLLCKLQTSWLTLCISCR